MTRKKKKDDWLMIILISIAIGILLGGIAEYYDISSVKHNIAKAMCWGQGAFDGKLYFKTVGSAKQLILRCYYIKPYGILRKETVLGWLSKEVGKDVG